MDCRNVPFRHWTKLRCIGRDDESRGDALKLASELPLEVFKRQNEEDISGDILIIAEALASGADLILTNNLSTINHVALNRWILHNGLRNQPVMQHPSLGISMLLEDRFDEFCHRSALNMTLSEQPRSREEDEFSLKEFVDNLKQATELCSTTIMLEEKRSDERENRWMRAREDIKRPEWVIARDVERSRTSKVKETVRNAGWDT